MKRCGPLKGEIARLWGCVRVWGNDRPGARLEVALKTSNHRKSRTWRGFLKIHGAHWKSYKHGTGLWCVQIKCRSGESWSQDVTLSLGPSLCSTIRPFPQPYKNLSSIAKILSSFPYIATGTPIKFTLVDISIEPTPHFSFRQVPHWIYQKSKVEAQLWDQRAVPVRLAFHCMNIIGFQFIFEASIGYGTGRNGHSPWASTNHRVQYKVPDLRVISLNSLLASVIRPLGCQHLRICTLHACQSSGAAMPVRFTIRTRPSEILYLPVVWSHLEAVLNLHTNLSK